MSEHNHVWNYVKYVDGQFLYKCNCGMKFASWYKL